MKRLFASRESAHLNLAHIDFSVKKHIVCELQRRWCAEIAVRKRCSGVPSRAYSDR